VPDRERGPHAERERERGSHTGPAPAGTGPAASAPITMRPEGGPVRRFFAAVGRLFGRGA
jgi:hypothetical protein